MIKFIYKFKYIYLLAYILTLYTFFITLSLKEQIFRRESGFDENQKRLVSTSTELEERKFFLDFKYKNQANPSLIKRFTNDLLLLDNEGHIVGCNSMIYDENLSTKFTFYLNKKFLHSCLYGSIKFIKL